MGSSGRDEHSVTEPASEPNRRKVFVIHGRNEGARAALFTFLRTIGLEPIEWSQAIAMTGQGSPYIGDVLEAAFGQAQAVVVLQTPDDVAFLHPSLAPDGDPETEPQMQPRPNVLFEAGMAMGRSPERTVLVELGQVKAFSDIHGRHVVRLDDSVAKRQDLAQRLATAGCQVDLTGRDWHTAGNLTPPPPPGGGLPLGRRLPATKASGRPRIDARYIDKGSGRLGEVEITNHGPGDVFDLNVEAEQKEGLLTRDMGLPVPKLPQGKSVRVMRAQSLQSGGGSYFMITVSGKTAEGEEISEEIFVS
jgi:predicted nucleotide-binding protein